MFGSGFNSNSLFDIKIDPRHQSTPRTMLSQMALRLDPLAARELTFYGQMQPRRFEAVQNAYNALDPRNDWRKAQIAQNRLLSQGREIGGQIAAQLASRGASSGAQRGAMLDAQNQALMQAMDFALQLQDPASIAQRYMAQVGLTDPSQLLSLMNSMAAFTGAAGSIPKPPRGPSLFESILPIAGGLLSQMGNR